MARTHMKDKTRKSIIAVLNQAGISNEIIEHAIKMDLDIPNLFFDKIINNNCDENKKIVVNNLLGVYGNNFATCYFEGMGYAVKNESPVYDDDDVTTYADIAFTDENGIKNFCEVKATKQILGNETKYVDPDYPEENCYLRYNEILKYKAIGEKLITQVTKLSKNNAIVNVIVFEGCYVDDEIRSELLKLGAKTITLYSNIYDLERNITEMVEKVSLYYNHEKYYDINGKKKK